MWQMVSLYYALPKEKESDCQKFNLSVQLIPGEFLCLSLKPGDLPFYCKYQWIVEFQKRTLFMFQAFGFILKSPTMT